MCGDARLLASGDFKLGLGEVAAGVAFPAAATAVVRAELAPSEALAMILGARVLAPAETLTAGIVDRIEDGDLLLDAAIAEADRLAGLPRDTYVRTKRQLRGETLARMERIVSHDDDPALQEWLSVHSADAARQLLGKRD
jgi:Delta3-Delta2-enoyl-CoA isomerase